MVERVNDLDHDPARRERRQRRRSLRQAVADSLRELTKAQRARCACARRAAWPTTARLLTTSVRWPDHTEAGRHVRLARITLAGRYAHPLGRHCMTATLPTVPLLIQGEFVESATTQWRDVVNPATQEPLARVPFATADEINAAIASAKAAFKTWRKTPIGARAQIFCCNS